MKTNSSRHKQSAKRLLQKVRLRYLAHHDVARFSRTASFSIYDAGYEQAVSRIMYNVHALEKGLARVNNRRPGFGQKALSDLNDALVVYTEAGYDLSGFAFEQGVSIIHRYAQFHAEEGVSVDFLPEIVSHEFLDGGADRGVGGTKVLRRSDKQENGFKNFRDLALGRHSVREFSGECIDTSKVLEALQLAERTPSVCNRQGWRVYWVEDPELSRQVLSHQRGFGYRQMPEVLLVITVSNNTFLSPVERNQAFVDGGLFAMSVMYGLEHEGLAAVPLNACMYHRDQLAVRQLLSIDDSEMIIMFIAVGDFPEETVVPLSDRKSAGSFVRRR